jgi:hypothetical protein
MTRSWLSSVLCACTALFVLAGSGPASVAAFSEDLDQAPVKVKRARVDLTRMTNRTTRTPLELVTPEMAQNIGPGSHLLIDIPNEGTFGCTSNFVFSDGSRQFLGAAGHCFIPAAATSTHGPGADFDASGVRVSVCVSDCSFGGQTGFVLTGNLVPLGQVAFARQTGADGDVGNDFGVVEIPASLANLVRPQLPVFGGPSTIEEVEQLQPLCHFGNGVVVGESFLSQGRMGIAGGSTPTTFMGDLLAAPGDSGSAVVTCERDGTALRGQGAAGVLTHLGVEACPCGIDPETGAVTAQQGIVFGTTTARALELAREAGLTLSVVFP